VTYGFAAQADVRGVNVTPIPGGNRFEAIVRHRDGSVRSIEGIELPMPGRHNVQNALAAIGVALELGIPDATIQQGFAKFGGVKRRFTKVGEVSVDGGVVTIIDDYGHHPVEIRAVLSAAREGVENRVIAVVQPHRYSRLGDLMEDFQQAFNDADMVLVAPVYAAGETPVPGVDADALVTGLKTRGHRSAQTVVDAADVARVLAEAVQPGDMVICLGAGDITKWAAGLADAIVEARA
jgi:UDP-N-acetylmuramate--alanine ligase